MSFIIATAKKRESVVISTITGFYVESGSGTERVTEGDVGDEIRVTEGDVGTEPRVTEGT